MKAEASLC